MDLIAVSLPTGPEIAHDQGMSSHYDLCFYSNAATKPVRFNGREKMHYVIFSD